MKQEIMDIINENDEVVGQATREDIYKNKKLHRIVHVLIFNDKGEMALQLRSKNTNYCPSHWSTTVGGHVDTGETWEQAAIRESEEEIGITPELKFLAKDLYTDPIDHNFKKLLTTYTAQYNGSFVNNPEEVEEARFFPIKTIKQMIKNGEKFHPELLFLLKKHY